MSPTKVFKYLQLVFVFLFFIGSAHGKALHNSMPQEPVKGLPSGRQAFQERQTNWVDTTFASLTLEEKIGQLFMVTAYSNLAKGHQMQIEKLITDYHIGGLIFMQGGPIRQAKLTNRYQSLSKIPLMLAMDAEYGLAMRLDSTLRFPDQMTLGAIEDERYIYQMGKEIARQLNRMGVHVNFAPVADVNINPNNPVIGWRSFGEDPENVARKAIAYMKGMQHHGVIANAKHFPGHGDTGTDSHYALPVIDKPYSQLKEVELYPFKRMVEDTLMSVMIAHLQVPAIDSVKNQATSLSQAAIKGVLRDSLGFRGLIFTDALNMKGVVGYNQPGELEVKALVAGNDILLSPEDVPKAVEAIKKAVEAGSLPEAEIDEKVRKILKAKFLVGLDHYRPIALEGLYEDLNAPRALALKAELYEQAVTIAKNKDGFIPMQNVQEVDFASVVIGEEGNNVFQQYLTKYAPFAHYQVSQGQQTQAKFDALYKELAEKDVVVVGLMGMNRSKSKRYGISAQAEAFIKKLAAKTKVIPVLFGNPYSLSYFKNQDFLVAAYEPDTLMQKAVPQVLFGAITSFGRLPVSAGDSLPVGMGNKVYSLGRMGFAFPESVGMDSRTLSLIDSIAAYAIDIEATPGCQVVVAKNGKIIFEKAYGHYTYSHKQKVTTESVYDLASLTKVFSTLQSVMLLEQMGAIELDSTLQTYLPELRGTNKGDLVIRDILAHQAGLKSFHPFWNNLMEGRQHKSDYISPVKSDSFSIQVSPDLYALQSIEDSVWKWLVETEMSYKGYRRSAYSYRYSDLGFMLLKGLVEKVAGQPLEDFVAENFYKPMGLKALGYKPMEALPQDQIVPTEMDIYYRKGLIHGFVHDPAAALQSGVGGHAGLFSNARDIAYLMQMNLQEGYYGGKWFLQPETLSKFNTRYFLDNRNRRALGWDKPGIMNISGPTSEYSSDKTFGHTGFTGTCAWADPVHDLVFVFLSNRIHPFVGNRKLIREDIRTDIQNVIYESMDGFGKKLEMGR